MNDTQHENREFSPSDLALEEWKVKHKVFYEATLGNEDAIKEVIANFMNMVHMWAHKYGDSCPSYVYDDIVQEGTIGILTAIKTFNLDKRTLQGKPVYPSTWVWWKIRASVQAASRRYHALYAETLSSTGHVYDMIEDKYETKDSSLFLDIESLLIEGCGSINCKRAQIVRDRFGLLGSEPLRQGEIAVKYRISKQAANKQIAKFFKTIRGKYPELRGGSK